MLDQLTAGDSLSFVTCVPDYPADDGWVLRFRLAPVTAGNAAIELLASAQGRDHLVSEAAATTTSWLAGTYGWTSWVERAGTVYTVSSGRVTILANPRTATVATDTRSPAERRLADLQAAYDAHISSGQAAVAEYTIGGRGMKFRDLAALISAIERAKTDVLQERRAARILRGQPGRQQLVTRM
jgi:hypothetical protein